MRRKVLIISGVFPPEPLTSAYLNYDLALALSSKYEVTVLRPYPSRPIGKDYKKELSSQVFPFQCITMDSYTYPKSKVLGRLRESISFGRACAKYIKQNHSRIDFIYNSSWQLFGYYIVAKVAVKYNIPYIVPIQDIYPECVIGTVCKNNPIKRFIYSSLLKIDKYYQSHAFRVRTISNEMANYLSSTRNIPLENYLIVNNWQNDEEYTYRNTPNNKGLVFGFVGSINAHANVELIISAFAKAEICNSELRIYGSGTNKEHCVNLVKKLNINNVIFSSVPREEVPKVQSEMDVLLVALPQGYAGLCLPSKITSYMLSGRAIIASIETPSAATRYIREANCGIVVDPDNEDLFVQAFKKISRLSKVEISKLGDNSKQFADIHLTRKANLDIVVNIIDEILK